MPESEDRGIAVMRGAAANDNGEAEARVDTAVLTPARLVDAGPATSNVPGADVRLRDSLVGSVGKRADEAEGYATRLSTEAGKARNAAATKA